MRIAIVVLALASLAGPASAGPSCKANDQWNYSTLNCDKQKCYYRNALPKLRDQAFNDSKAMTDKHGSVLQNLVLRYQATVVSAGNSARQRADQASSPANCPGCENCIGYAREREVQIAAQVQEVMQLLADAHSTCMSQKGNLGSAAIAESCLEKQRQFVSKEQLLKQGLDEAVKEANEMGSCGSNSAAKQSMESLGRGIASDHGRQLDVVGKDPCERGVACERPVSTFNMAATLDIVDDLIAKSPGLAAIGALFDSAQAAADEARKDPQPAKEFMDYAQRVSRKSHVPAEKLLEAYNAWPRNCR